MFRAGSERDRLCFWRKFSCSGEEAPVLRWSDRSMVEELLRIGEFWFQRKIFLLEQKDAILNLKNAAEASIWDDRIGQRRNNCSQSKSFSLFSSERKELSPSAKKKPNFELEKQESFDFVMIEWIDCWSSLQKPKKLACSCVLSFRKGGTSSSAEKDRVLNIDSTRSFDFEKIGSINSSRTLQTRINSSFFFKKGEFPKWWPEMIQLQLRFH